MNRNFIRQLRTLLILGRVSNLPTVWSNCLAGWWLGGGGNFWKLPLLLFGVSALYTGGMFLNDAFDADFDRQRRPERPIPSGAISLAAVWGWGLAWLALGALCLTVLGQNHGRAGAGAGPVHHHLRRHAQGHHRLAVADGRCAGSGFMSSPGPPALGRERLADLVRRGAGVLCRRPEPRGAAGKFRAGRFPAGRSLLLAAPVVLAMLMDAGENRVPALWLSLVLVLWIARCVRTIFQGGEVNVGRIVSGLLAGIVFVDWLAVAPGCPHALSACVFNPVRRDAGAATVRAGDVTTDH